MKTCVQIKSKFILDFAYNCKIISQKGQVLVTPKLRFITLCCLHTTSGGMQVDFQTLLWSAHFCYLTGRLKIASSLALPVQSNALDVTAAVIEAYNGTILITFTGIQELFLE